MKTYHKTIALLIVTAVFATFTMARPATTAADFIPASLKTQISSDATTVESFPVIAVSHLVTRELDLRKKGTLTAQDIASFQSEANSLKSQLSNLKNSLSSLISKLRNAGKFSPELDAFVDGSVRAKSADAATKLRSLGGARAILDGTSNTISGAINEISGIQADPLFRPRVGFLDERDFNTASRYRLTPVAFRTPTTPAVVPAFGKIALLKCAVLGTRLIIKTIKGTDTQQDVDDFKNCDS